MRLILIATCLIPLSAQADQAADRRIAAIPALVEQRNGALDALAVCVGDNTMLQVELKKTRKQLDAAKADIEKLDIKSPEKLEAGEQ